MFCLCTFCSVGGRQAWSRSNFLLSASMDKTVRLWHITRPKCLSMFQHSDFVTAVAFHPTEDRLFMSGSFDKKIRMWDIPDHKVIEWAQTPNMITAAAFSPDGKMVVAGLHSGEVIFHETIGLKYFTQIECKNRHGKDKNGRKVTGLQYLPQGKKLLISTNDSRLRLFNTVDFNMVTKFKGLENDDDLQICATFSEDGENVVSGSDDSFVYVWNTEAKDTGAGFFSSLVSKDTDTNQSYEKYKVHEGIVTVARFAPTSTQRFARSAPEASDGSDTPPPVIVSAGYV
jgi:WD40 repeat protein